MNLITIRPSPSFGLDLFMEDCLDGMGKRIQPGQVDVVVTSPPYNLGIKYNSYDDSRSREEYLAWTEKWAAKVREVLSDDGSFFLNIGSKPSDPWVPFEVISVLRSIFHLQNVIHWIKSIAIEKRDIGNYPGITQDVSVGHYKPIGGERFLNDCHEYIFHLTKSGHVPLDRLAIGVPYQDKSNIGRWHSAQQDLRCRGNTWFIPYKTIRDKSAERPHPATFPVRLPEMCIRLHGLDRCRLVMDPFMGLGNTALACIELKKDFIGFEIDPDYYDLALKRINQLVSASRYYDER